MKHRLVVIGYIGMKRCFLDVTREEALRRYDGPQDYFSDPNHTLEEFEFDDEFGAYDATHHESLRSPPLSRQRSVSLVQRDRVGRVQARARQEARPPPLVVGAREVVRAALHRGRAGDASNRRLLAEEFGEVGREVTEELIARDRERVNSASAEVTEIAVKAETKKLKEELIQLAAVAVAWAESLP